MYVYKKSDKKKENPIPLEDGVNYKTLWNKAEKIEDELRDLAYGKPGVPNLMFDSEDGETQREIFQAIDHVKSFRENLKLKSNIGEE